MNKYQKAIAFILTLAMSFATTYVNTASAATLSFDTEYGQMDVVEDGYSDYFMWDQDDEHYVVFYNEDLVVIDGDGTYADVKFPGTTKIYRSATNYIPETREDAVFTMRYASSTYYASSKDINLAGTELPAREQPLSGQTTNFAGTTEVSVDIEATVINITVPLNVNCIINPNIENGLTHGDIVIQNNTKAPVRLSLASFTSNNLPFTNLILPTELPAPLEWNLLNSTDSMKYFSFGIKASDDGETPWKNMNNDFTWATPSFVESEIGIIEGDSSSELILDARYGRAISSGESFQFLAVFVAELE